MGTVAVYLLLVVLLRLFGKRILAQLNPFDFVVLVTLSNTVQNAIIGNDTSLSGGVIGALSLLVINAALVRIYYRGPESTIESPDTYLVRDHRVDADALRGLHINRAELVARAHERGFDDLDEVDTAVLNERDDLHEGDVDGRGVPARNPEGSAGASAGRSIAPRLTAVHALPHQKGTYFFFAACLKALSTCFLMLL